MHDSGGFGEVNGKFGRGGSWLSQSRLEAAEGIRHEAENENSERDECAEAAVGVQGDGVVDGENAEETNAEEKGAPNVPAGPEMKNAEKDESEGEKNR